MTNQTLGLSNEQLSLFNAENIGLVDRVLRIAAAALLIGQILLWREDPSAQSYLVLLGLYPAFTALIGWDPLYALSHGRTCGRSPYSVCGSLSDQVRAAARGWRRGALAKVLPLHAAPAPAGGAEAANDSERRDRAA